MTDILIRNVPTEHLARLDHNAKAQGLSREEYLRRKIAQEQRPTDRTVTLEDLRAFAERHKDLLDEDVMHQAWS